MRLWMDTYFAVYYWKLTEYTIIDLSDGYWECCLSQMVYSDIWDSYSYISILNLDLDLFIIKESFQDMKKASCSSSKKEKQLCLEPDWALS